jgi:hypothetical protein
MTVYTVYTTVSWSDEFFAKVFREKGKNSLVNLLLFNEKRGGKLGTPSSLN